MDTSVWIDLLGKNRLYKVQPDDFLLFVTCPPILQEVFQGIRDEHAFLKIRAGLLSIQRVADPVHLEDHLLAAEIYRTGRRRGLSIRSSIDCLIAAIAIREKLPVWHHDRDFMLIAKYTELKTRTNL